MSEAVMQHGAIAPPTGGRLMRRLNLGTAVAGGLIGGLPLLVGRPPLPADRRAVHVRPGGDAHHAGLGPRVPGRASAPSTGRGPG